MVHFKTLSGQKDALTTISEPATFIRQFPQTLPHVEVTPLLIPILLGVP